jgi:hypothetical protein
MNWGSLLKIAGVAGAPFTGGASLALTAGLGALGAATSGAAKGAEAERTAADTYGLKRDDLGLTAAQVNERALADRARLELDQHAQSLKSGESAFQNALRASVVNNFKSAARPNGVANISFVNGGPSQGARDAATAMDREAMVRLLEGEKFAPQAAYTPYTLQSSAAPKKASTMEKILGIVGAGSTGYSGMMRDLQKSRENTDL